MSQLEETAGYDEDQIFNPRARSNQLKTNRKTPRFSSYFQTDQSPYAKNSIFNRIGNAFTKVCEWIKSSGSNEIQSFSPEFLATEEPILQNTQPIQTTFTPAVPPSITETQPVASDYNDVTMQSIPQSSYTNSCQPNYMKICKILNRKIQNDSALSQSEFNLLQMLFSQCTEKPRSYEQLDSSLFDLSSIPFVKRTVKEIARNEGKGNSKDKSEIENSLRKILIKELRKSLVGNEKSVTNPREKTPRLISNKMEIDDLVEKPSGKEMKKYKRSSPFPSIPESDFKNLIQAPGRSTYSASFLDFENERDTIEEFKNELSTINLTKAQLKLEPFTFSQQTTVGKSTEIQPEAVPIEKKSVVSFSDNQQVMEKQFFVDKPTFEFPKPSTAPFINGTIESQSRPFSSFNFSSNPTDTTMKISEKESCIEQKTPLSTSLFQFKPSESTGFSFSSQIPLNETTKETPTGESKTLTFGESKPSISSESKPSISDEPKPFTFGESKPFAFGESKPFTFGESKPFAFGESKQDTKFTFGEIKTESKFSFDETKAEFKPIEITLQKSEVSLNETREEPVQLVETKTEAKVKEESKTVPSFTFGDTKPVFKQDENAKSEFKFTFGEVKSSEDAKIEPKFPGIESKSVPQFSFGETKTESKPSESKSEQRFSFNEIKTEPKFSFGESKTETKFSFGEPSQVSSLKRTAATSEMTDSEQSKQFAFGNIQPSFNLFQSPSNTSTLSNQQSQHFKPPTSVNFSFGSSSSVNPFSLPPPTSAPQPAFSGINTSQTAFSSSFGSQTTFPTSVTSPTSSAFTFPSATSPNAAPFTFPSSTTSGVVQPAAQPLGFSSAAQPSFSFTPAPGPSSQPTSPTFASQPQQQRKILVPKSFINRPTGGGRR